MNRYLKTRRLNLPGSGVLGLLGILTLIEPLEAQPFVYQNNDLCLGFRKNTPYTESYEVVVNIGQASNYLSAPIGTTMPVQGFSASQMVPGCFATLNNLSWSVCGYYSGSGYGASYPANVQFTDWVTVPRTDNAVRSADAYRMELTLQRNVRPKIVSILLNAAYISHDVGTSNQFNTVSFVRESISLYPQHLLSIWMGSLNNNTKGTLNDAWPPDQPNDGNLEHTTPDNFSSPVRSDLYEVRPLTDGQKNPVTDPHTGTTGLAYYVGYFELKPDGSMTFTREEAGTPVNPPPAPRLSIARSGDVSSITFLSTNKATYTLLYTNSAGLTAPAGTWPSLPDTITGDGSTNTFQDTTTDTNRFYRVEGR